MQKPTQVQIRQILQPQRQINHIEIISTTNRQNWRDFSDQLKRSVKTQTKQQTLARLRSPKQKKNRKKQSSDYMPARLDDSSEEKIDDGEQKETKNIPKLYGKAITLFIQKMQPEVEIILKREGLDKKDFYKKVAEYQKQVISIQGMRQMWQDQSNEYARMFRILSGLFLRKHILHHIFNSKICLCKRALKYRYKFLQGVKKPSKFTLIKQF